MVLNVVGGKKERLSSGAKHQASLRSKNRGRLLQDDGIRQGATRETVFAVIVVSVPFLIVLLLLLAVDDTIRTGLQWTW